MKRRKHKEEQLKRVSRQTIMFNEREVNALNAYFMKYKVKNRSKFMREAIITAVLKRFDDDYPTLFDTGQPSLFSHN